MKSSVYMKGKEVKVNTQTPGILCCFFASHNALSIVENGIFSELGLQLLLVPPFIPIYLAKDTYILTF